MKVNIGKSIELDVDADKLPANVMAHVVYIGLRNILMDSHAGEPEHDNALAVATKKLESMYAGIVRVAGTREGDPVRAEAIRICTARITAALRKAGRKVSDVDPKAIREKAIAAIDDAVLEMARARVAQVKAVDGGADLIEGL